jgi:hypothetical protein
MIGVKRLLLAIIWFRINVKRIGEENIVVGVSWEHLLLFNIFSKFECDLNLR